MLYQSLPLFFHFQPSATTLLRPSQREKEMECVEFTALKSSFWDEMMVAGKSSQQALSSEVWVGNGAGEDFFVDDLLDLSNEEEEKGSLASVSSLGEEARFDAAGENANSQAGLPLKEDFVGISSSELAVPTDDIAELEWLSNFVDESFSEFPSQTHSVPLQATPTGKPESETRNREWGFDIDKTRIPAKARSKRHRAAPRVRRLGGHADHEPPTSSSSSSTSSSHPPPCLIFAHPLFHCLKKPDSKKWRRGGKEKAGAAGVQRRCSHCLVQKTPQWRAGPLGSKTLCNACGVRFKSGRLLPEYRPAGSPTFMSAVHSNSHRKVLEMRRKKEEVGSDEPARSF